ncbi:unnamed protein product [Caenorhabditis bovis]|uniref:Succinate dehydrogenase [ubiquinone] cytochrome b small subunit n=1 Tax=Caenorhabditis bovis TaxID=2654633 RepID=A0A8S1EVV1_9PELO|nr:unnamed protein product [Caenorhabditis bovis]
MAASLRHLARFQHAIVAARTAPRLCTAVRTSTTLNDGASKVPDHSLHFKVERYWAAGMLPIIPASYFIHSPVMDTLLTIALTLHIHWGVEGVLHDYARPFVLGDGLAKIAHMSVYLITGLLLAGLLHFNTNDVGLTKAFEMVFAL